MSDTAMRRMLPKLGQLHLGFVGGGIGSGIGATHYYASHLHGQFKVVAGVFSTDEGRNKLAGDAYGVATDRIYRDYAEMAAAESARPDGIHAAAIVAPNHIHAPASIEFVRRGIDVVCDKPLATNLKDARTLAAEVEKSGTVFVITYNNSGYPTVREARERIAAGAIGEVRVVQVEFAASNGVERLEEQGIKSMIWRTDLNVVGPSAVLADVGVHAHHLACFVTSLEVAEISAELTTMVPGRSSDDNAHVLMRFNSGARGMLWASFVAAGNGTGLRLRVFGSTGSLHWNQETPEFLHIRPQGAPHYTLRRGESWLGKSATRATRLVAGAPEGSLEAFANIYSDAAELIRARRDNRIADPGAMLCPTINDGVRGLAFIEAAARSHYEKSRWTQIV